MSSRGFTLLEALICLIAIGVLAAIAIPNFLSFIEKARGTEAQQILAAGLDAQEARHLELGRFADGWQELGLDVGQTERYEYLALAPEPTKEAMLRAIPKLKQLFGYVAGIETIITKKHGQVYKTVICKSKKLGIQPIKEAEVEFKKRRVVCTNKFQKVG